MRSLLLMILLAGCDKLFSLQVVPEPVADAPVPVDVAIDAPPNAQGCADATREGFVDIPTFPALAACAGAGGVGCTATDLCAAS